MVIRRDMNIAQKFTFDDPKNIETKRGDIGRIDYPAQSNGHRERYEHTAETNF